MTEIYRLEKAVWTEKDFEVMNWHDNKIHSFATFTDEKKPWKNEILFDIDYIFK